MHYFKSLTCLALICGTHASAATITAGVARGSIATEETADTSSGQTEVSVSENFLGFSNTRLLATAAASADANTGQLRAQVEKIEDVNPFGDSVNAVAQFDESMTLTGNGTITFNLDYSGFWDVDVGTIFQINTGLNIFDNEILVDNDVVAFANFLDPIVDNTAGNLTVSATVNGTRALDFSAALVVWTSRGQGIVDFSNTANLSFETTGNVAVSFADPDFLSGVSGGPIDPVVPAVPLPAGLPLVMTAFGFLGVLRLRRGNA